MFQTETKRDSIMKHITIVSLNHYYILTPKTLKKTKCLKSTKLKDGTQTLVSFHVLSDSGHQAQLEHHQGLLQLNSLIAVLMDA